MGELNTEESGPIRDVRRCSTKSFVPDTEETGNNLFYFYLFIFVLKRPEMRRKRRPE